MMFEPHPIALRFPRASDEDYTALLRSIAERGLETPIVLYRGRTLDGVNRDRACDELGIEPRTVDFTGTDPVSFVVAQNLARRHLTPSQRGKLAVDFLPELEEETHANMVSGGRKGGALTSKQRRKLRQTRVGSPDPTLTNEAGKASAKAGAQMGVSGPLVRRVLKVQREAPDLYDRIGDDLTVNKAVTMLRERGRDSEPSPKPLPTKKGRIRSPAVEVSERAAADRAALKLVTATTNAGHKMYEARDDVDGAIVRIRHQQDVAQLALHIGWTVRYLQRVERTLRGQMSQSAIQRLDSSFVATGFEPGMLRVIEGGGAA